MAKRGPRGQYDLVRFPKHFQDRARRKYMQKDTSSELKVFDAVSSATTSAPVSVNRVRNFTVMPTGTLNVTVQTSPTPDVQSSWNNLQTGVTATAPYSNSDHYPHIRLVYASGSGDAIVFRNFLDGTN